VVILGKGLRDASHDGVVRVDVGTPESGLDFQCAEYGMGLLPELGFIRERLGSMGVLVTCSPR